MVSSKVKNSKAAKDKRNLIYKITRVNGTTIGYRKVDFNNQCREYQKGIGFRRNRIIIDNK